MKKITLLLLTIFAFFGWQAQAQFAESFDAGIPATWTVNNVDGGLYTWANNTTFPHSGAGNVVIHWETAAHNDYLISPTITVTNGVSNRVSFWAGINGTYWTEAFQVKLSTTGTAPADFTVVLGTQTATTDVTVGSYTNYTYDLSAYNGQNVHIAIVATDTDRYYLYVDDFVNDAPPNTIPSCATGLVATSNATCGNFPTSLTWNAVTGVTGYNLSIGTTPGGTNVLNNQNLGVVTSYSFTSPTPNTTYYWNLTPFNGVGPAVGCAEQSFTTFATPCFCTPAPSSVDGIGITNVTFGTINNTTADEPGHYGDYSIQSTDVAQGLTQNLTITYATGYTYGTKIWVDWNNDYDFVDTGELVYTGLSTNANPTTLSASFVVPAAATLGSHRMRIGGTDADAGPTSPCYTGTYGTFEDYTINVIVASCTPPAATASITGDCGNNQYFVTVNVTNLGSGTPSISNGTTTWPIAGIGNVQVGPFANGSSVTLTVLHGSNGACNLPLGLFTYTCPPVNDNCSGAIALTVNTDLACTTVTPGTVSGATASTVDATACFGTEDDDVWFSFVATNASHRIRLLNVAGSTTDMFHSLWTGADCNSLSLVAGSCSDADTSNPSGLTIGNTYYLRVNTYTATAGQNSTFNVCIGTLPPPPANDTCTNATIVNLLPYTFTQDATSATNNAGVISTCGTGMNDGVWYTFNVATPGDISIALTGVTGWDPEIGVYSGTCGTFTCIGFVDAGGTGGAETLNLTALAAGQYWVNLGHYNGTTDSPEGPLTIGITGTAVLLGTNSFDNANFAYYPNPVKNMLNLSYTENISEVSVYNLLGQQVIAKAINANQSQIDMSHLSSGTYMVKVTADNQVKMIKVIKE